MLIEDLLPGDTIFAAEDIINDGSMPDAEPDALLAKAGQRGVIINTGYLEEQPSEVLILVSFEKPENKAELGPAVACRPEELRMLEETSQA